MNRTPFRSSSKPCSFIYLGIRRLSHIFNQTVASQEQNVFPWALWKWYARHSKRPQMTDSRPWSWLAMSIILNYFSACMIIVRHWPFECRWLRVPASWTWSNSIGHRLFGQWHWLLMFAILLSDIGLSGPFFFFWRWLSSSNWPTSENICCQPASQPTNQPTSQPASQPFFCSCERGEVSAKLLGQTGKSPGQMGKSLENSSKKSAATRFWKRAFVLAFAIHGEISKQSGMITQKIELSVLLARFFLRKLTG